MPETSYPIPCGTCKTSLYGKVDYCPYCGCLLTEKPPPPNLEELRPAPGEHGFEPPTEDPPPSPAPGPKEPPPAPMETAPPYFEPVAPGNGEKIHCPKKTAALPVEPKQAPAGREKSNLAPALVVLTALLIAGAAGFYLYGYGVLAPGSQNAIARAGQALDKGIQLSILCTNLPRLEKRTKTAKKLYDINPSKYKDTFTAEKKLMALALKKRQDLLAAYIRLAGKLDKSDPNFLSRSLASIQAHPQGDRGRQVAGLLARHVPALKKHPPPGSQQILSDFTRQFK